MSSTVSASSGAAAAAIAPFVPDAAARAVLAALGAYSTLRLSWASSGVLRVHISQGKLNAMNKAFWKETREAFGAIAKESAVRVVWLTAEGKVFSAGLDLQDHADSFLTDSSGDIARRTFRMKAHIEEYQASFSSLEKCPQPIVAAIQGACIGGGVDLVTAADIRWVCPEAYFSVAEVTVGLAADVGSLQRLPKIVGNQSAIREWCLTGRNISAAEALQTGLVSRVCASRDALLAESLALCMTIAAKSPVAVMGTKANLLYARDHSVAQGLEYIATWNAAALQSEDVGVAMQASMSKQQPIYSNL